MRLRWILRALGALALLVLAAPAQAPLGAAPLGGASLTVIVENLRSSNGFLHVAIWNTPQSFADGSRTLAKAAVPAADGAQRIVFDHLTPGRYAIAVYHDENGNGEFDRTAIGLPAEGLGFSNDAWLTLLGPPSFEEAAVMLKGPGADAVIKLRY